jgi:hypothetical protein
VNRPQSGCTGLLIYFFYGIRHSKENANYAGRQVIATSYNSLAASLPDGAGAIDVTMKIESAQPK